MHGPVPPAKRGHVGGRATSTGGGLGGGPSEAQTSLCPQTPAETEKLRRGRPRHGKTGRGGGRVEWACGPGEEVAAAEVAVAAGALLAAAAEARAAARAGRPPHPGLSRRWARGSVISSARGGGHCLLVLRVVNKHNTQKTWRRARSVRSPGPCVEVPSRSRG
eukprot:SAG11_NODE_1313_length_5225_cov_4.247171_2_plen_163_part_00